MKTCSKHLFALVMVVGGVVLPRAHAAGQKPFTVKDSIEMTTFSDPYTRLANAECQRSPDHKYFLVITTRGILSRNQLESTLSIYSAHEVDEYLHGQIGHPPQPQVLFRITGTPIADQSNSYGSLITKARWSSDSRSILSLVEMPNGDRHLYRSYVIGRKSVDLTPGKTNIVNFSEAGETIAYLVANTMTAPKEIGEPINDGSADLTGLSFFHLFFPNKFPDRSSFFPTYNLWVHYKGVNRKVNADGTWHFPRSALGLRVAVSPNGQALIAAEPVPTVLAAWSEYKVADSTSSFAPSHTNTDRSGKSFSWPWQYIYVDLDKMTSTPLVDAPSGFLEGYVDALQAVWSPDSRRVLFTNSYLPLPDGSETRGTEETTACAAAVYTVATKSAACIAYARFPRENEWLRSAAFGASSNQAILHWSDNGRGLTEIYEETQHGWTVEPEMATSEARQQELRLFIKQDINEPPTLWASEPKAGLAKELWNPNPQLASIELGQASVYTWKDHSGYEWRGGLVLPPNFVRGRRYPLVIQTHGFFNEHEFLVDGSYTTGFAARALAAAGIIVLQVEDRPDRHSQPAQQEALLAVKGFKAAIDQLDKDGLIDPSRVGIIGFSRTAWYVEEALIHEPHLFRAATLIDGIDQSYMSYMLFAPGDPILGVGAEAVNGAKPFGVGLESWLKNAPGFNLNKVETPVRIEALGRISLLGEWEIYSSLYQQGKPVDLVYIPTGQHILQSPKNRYASQQGNVDWFRFWLQGYEAPDPAKTSQYKRWERLREMQEANKKSAEPLTGANASVN